MSLVVAAPDAMAAAAADLAGINSTLSTANSSAAAAITEVSPAAGDEVSAAISALLGAHGQSYRAMSAQAAAFHAQIVEALNAGAGAYASTDAANAAPLQTVEQDLLNLINAPFLTLTGRPLIGNGGISGLIGNGGNGGNGGNSGSLFVSQGGAGGKARLLGANGSPGLLG